MKSKVLKRVRERYNTLPEITWNVFIASTVSFFMASLISTIGGIVDSFIVGHTMDVASAGAMSLISPIWFLSAVIYGVLNAGVQPRITLELGKGNQDRAREIFSMVLDTGMILASLISAMMLLCPGVLTRWFGAAPGSPEYEPCIRYLGGLSLGIPALVAGNIISASVNLEGDRKWHLYYAAAVTVVNILLDLLVVAVHGDLLMLGMTSSLSYIAALIVYQYYYHINDEAVLRPEHYKISFSLIGSIVIFGLPMGVRKITSIFRSVYMNRLLETSVVAYGVAAYNVQVQLNYLLNDLYSDRFRNGDDPGLLL